MPSPQTRQLMARIATLALSLVVLAVAAATALATSNDPTLDFFQKEVSFKVTTATGTPPPAAAPVPGDVIDESDLDYVGNGEHHAKQYTATDHVRCTFTTAPTSPTGSAQAVCDAAIAIGGSLLVADHVTATLSASAATVPINGGVGKYAGFKGVAVSKSIGNTNNSNFTITIHR